MFGGNGTSILIVPLLSKARVRLAIEVVAVWRSKERVAGIFREARLRFIDGERAGLFAVTSYTDAAIALKVSLSKRNWPFLLSPPEQQRGH